MRRRRRRHREYSLDASPLNGPSDGTMPKRKTSAFYPELGVGEDLICNNLYQPEFVENYSSSRRQKTIRQTPNSLQEAFTVGVSGLNWTDEQRSQLSFGSDMSVHSSVRDNISSCYKNNKPKTSV